jgi:drug/metabolite transporter (DMT)-like permease
MKRLSPVSRGHSRKSSALNNKRALAFAEALLGVALWSSSAPLTKLAYAELDPLHIMSIRYSGAFLLLFPVLWMRSRPTLRKLQRREWIQLIFMGLLSFTLGNPLLYIGLQTIPATTSSFLMNGIPIATLMLGALTLREYPRLIQWGGILLASIGGIVFFGGHIELSEARGIGLSLIGVLLITIFGLLARDMTRRERIDPVALTAIPMGFGSVVLLAFIWPLPMPSLKVLGILAWLTFVNSAIAFVLWNHALKRLQAFEISITGNLMPIGTALLAPIFLGEPVSSMAWLGISLSLIGVILVGVGGKSAPLRNRMI